MKANELRIGNKVSIDDRETTVTNGIVFDYDEGAWYVNNINVRIVQPISLTEDWLFKFGFEKKNGYGFEMFGNWIQKRENIYWYNLNGNFVILKHVHQLQNLYFALTQKELICSN